MDAPSTEFNHISRFTTHAIESITSLHKFIGLHHPNMQDDFPETIKLMREAQKFVLPYEGALVDMKSYRSEYASMLRLPYPVISLEFLTSKDAEAEDATDGDKLVISSRHIILAWCDEYPTHFRVSGAKPATIYFTHVWYDDEQGEWEPSPVVGGFDPAELETDSNGEFLVTGFRSFPCHKNAVSRMQATNPNFDDLIHNDLSTLVKPLFEFCLTVNCQNVKTVEVPPPVKLQKKRQKNGREPYYTYHVLQLSQQTVSTKEVGLGYERNGSRVHWRRGHLRHLQSGQVVWVRPAIIGNPELGLVDKTYSLTPSIVK
jgi:hypothetical protein